jgi:hypothetical protein
MNGCSWLTRHSGRDGEDRCKFHRARTQHELRRVSLTGQCEAAGAGAAGARNGAPHAAGVRERVQTEPTAGLAWGR